MGDQGRRARACVLATKSACHARYRRTGPHDRQLPRARALLRRTARLDIHSCACRRPRQFYSGAGGAMTAVLVPLKRAAWLREGPLGRLLAVLDHDGEEARVVGGAVRNALLGEP